MTKPTYLQMCIRLQDNQLEELRKIQKQAAALGLDTMPVVEVIKKVQAARETLFWAQENYGKTIHDIESKLQ